MRPPFTCKPLPNSVEDVSGIFEITELWRPHFKHADDLVILSPSVSRLSELMQVCGLYGLNHDIKYNSKKSAVLIFKSN